MKSSNFIIIYIKKQLILRSTQGRIKVEGKQSNLLEKQYKTRVEIFLTDDKSKQSIPFFCEIVS